MKSDEKSIQAITAKAHAAEADLKVLQKKLRLEQKRVTDRESLIENLRNQISDLTLKLNEKVDEISKMMHTVVNCMTGKGQATLTESIRDAVVQGVKEQYEQQLQEQKLAYESVIASLKEEIKHLRNHGDINDGMSPETKIKVLMQQIADLQTQAYGQKTESKHHHRKPVESADDTDLKGEDTPEMEDVVSDKEAVEAADEIIEKTKRNTGKGEKKPRRVHPLEKFSETIDVDPDYIPEGAQKEGSDMTTRIYWVNGYFRILHSRRNKWRLGNQFYQAPAGPNASGHMAVDKSVLAYLFHKHFVQNVTIGALEQELCENGLNFAHSTVQHWFDLVADKFKYLDIPLHDTICMQTDVHADESTISVCDKPILEEDNQEEAFVAMHKSDVEESDDIPQDENEADEHYFIRWLFCFLSTKVGLVQYYFHNRGRRTRRALQAYMKGVDHKMTLHSDGAKLYKCYDISEFIIRIACAVHMRRPFYKLKDTSLDAKEIVDLFDEIFHIEKLIKEEIKDEDEKKEKELRTIRRNLEIGPKLHAIKNKLDELLSHLEKESEPELLKAVKYAITEFPCLLRCLEDSSLEWSNNICEQQMRRIAIYRNNSFHCGSVKSVERFCRMNSLVQSCKMNGKSFQRYIDDTIGKAEIIVKAGYTALKAKCSNGGTNEMKSEITWEDVVKDENIKPQLVSLLPHLWEDKYQFAFEYSKAQRQK